MRVFTIFAVYEEDFDQRYTEHVEAEDAEQAERIAKRDAPADIIVAGVVEGKVLPVDQVEEAKVTPIRGKGFTTSLSRVSVKQEVVKLVLKCPACKTDFHKPDSLNQLDLLSHQTIGRIPRGEYDGLEGICINEDHAGSRQGHRRGPVTAWHLSCAKCGHVLWDGLESEVAANGPTEVKKGS